MKLDWDHLRFFLAVIEHGSTKRAARALRVDQTTCARRIGALESALGLELFTRDDGRYRPTADALGLVEAARAMETAASQFSDQAKGRTRARTRRIKVTVDEFLSATIVVPAVARFAELHPDVHVEMDVSAQVRDLVAGEADIAVRGGLEPTEPELVRRKLADDAMGIYCSKSYASPPLSREELPGHPIVCIAALKERLEAAGLGPSVRHVSNSVSALRAMVAEGGVVGLLPQCVAEAPPPLRLCIPIAAPTAIWLIYPERLRVSPEVKALGRQLAEQARRVRKAPVSA